MRKAIDTKREKLKWLSALCLCLLCLSLCLGMLAQPTLAAAGLDPLKDLARIDALNWGDGACGSNQDSFGDMQANSCLVGGTFTFGEPGTIGWARYKLDKKYDKISGKLACSDTSTSNATMRLKLYADDKAEPIYTSGPILRGTRPFEFSVSLKDVNVLKMELVQMDVTGPPLPAGVTPKGFLLLVNPMLEWQTPPPSPPPSSSTSTTAKPAPVPLKDATLLAPAVPPVYGSNKDSFGNTHADSCAVGGECEKTGPTGSIGFLLYQLDKKYIKLSGKLACAQDGDDDAILQLRMYADGAATPFYTSPPIKRDTQPFDFSVDVGNVTVLKIDLVDTKGVLLPVNAWALLINPLLELVPPVALTEPTSTTTGVSPSSLYSRYEPVYGWAGLYLLIESTETLPALTTQHGAIFWDPTRTFVFSFSRQPETDRVPVYIKNNKYYFGLLKNDVYVALTPNGMYDIDDAIWAGPDKIFGSPDDKVAVRKAFEPGNSLFYEESPGVWKFLVHCRDFVDSRWNTIYIDPTNPTTTTAPTSTGTIGTTTTGGFLTTGDPGGPPKTGVPFNPGLLVCIAALFMGCAYCGYRLLRKERV